ncbi:class I SAM-dependent methyltransferase [Chitinophaga cymbidii]|uniref:Methyltransferase type 11 domain-containing protein n=1 Tax=Chitinophaga cymbidii TaxID=1096750 RepID=A0A512RNW3_9BACT|nr:class I SAM-dependent methyltransferase [Chitinophaga cymbidii]GEP97385.1 hypothetical protein CCY01nite_36450 [Chitinophaga cymbidii]
MENKDQQYIAGQLKCPAGEDGIKAAERMNDNNAGVIGKTLELTAPADGDAILELGPGNGYHVKELLSAANNLRYTGIDISKTMVAEAGLMNRELVSAGVASFLTGDGRSLPFPDHSFDKFLTVNTLYFWENAQEMLREIWRVLKPGGSMVLSFGSQRFMQHLPFVQYGFQLYNEPEVLAMLEAQGLQVQSTGLYFEDAKGMNGEVIKKEFILIKAVK